ncbi:MAG: hypothetical protein ACRDZR_13200 [Acidimicrobiales bacterium]
MARGRRVPVHYLRPNETNWSPSAVAFFDTETLPEKRGTDELHVLRLWCAQSLRRDKPGGGQRTDTREHGRTGWSLADWIERQARSDRALWIWAHNLAYDLTTTRLLTHLSDKEWSLGEFGVTDRNPWFRLQKGSKHVTLVDSWSWLPDALEHLGELAGVKKPALPTWADEDVAWLTRCFGDVDTLAASVLSLLDWWDKEQLGRFTITGASTGWNAMRHKLRARELLIDPTESARTFERQAIRGGRREVTRVGELAGGPFAQLDMVRAHCTIAEHRLLPRRRLGAFERLALTDPLWDRQGRGAIAWARVAPTEPRYPLKLHKATWWPVGEFWTVLAWPELQMARRMGDLREVGPGIRYGLGNGMNGWAQWCNRVAAGETPTAPAVASLAAKSWGRSVIGKTASHTSELVKRGPALHVGWFTEPAVDAATGRRATLLTTMGERWWVQHEQNADECFPAVLAWVESELRVAMATTIDVLGDGVVVSCDTDGLVVDLAVAAHMKGLGGAARLERASPWLVAGRLCDWVAPLVAPLELRTKHVYAAMAVTGPLQQLRDGKRMFSGVPNSAHEVKPRTMVAHTWPKLRWQMAHGDERGYVRPQITYRLAGRYVRRWVLPDGTIWPIEARVTGPQTSELVGWAETAGRPDCELESELQHPTVAAL